MLTIFCPKCYAHNSPDAEFCSSCGARLNDETGDFVERLINFSLHHPIPSLPQMAAQILGRIGDQRAVEPLIQILDSSEEPGLLEAAAEALGKLGDPRAIPSLKRLARRGTVAARIKAVIALGEIGGDEAETVLEHIKVNDPSPSVRERSESVLREIRARRATDGGSRPEDRPLEALGEAHKRGISVTLTMVDEALCEVEEWANGREIHSVLYQERNKLSDVERAKLASEVSNLRNLLRELRDTLGLEPTVRDAKIAIRSKCAGLWEHIVELEGRHLARYGDVPASLSQYIEPRAEELIQGLLRILDALRG